jgi:hypothetical protein
MEKSYGTVADGVEAAEKQFGKTIGTVIFSATYLTPRSSA